MSYILFIIPILIGLFLTGVGFIGIADEYSKSHPTVERLYFGGKDAQPNIIPMYVKGIIEWDQSNIAAVLNWGGDRIKLSHARLTDYPEDKQEVKP